MRICMVVARAELICVTLDAREAVVSPRALPAPLCALAGAFYVVAGDAEEIGCWPDFF